jgi:O-antigen/teichoic acid export membrane protein
MGIGGTVTKTAQQLKAQARLQFVLTIIFLILTIAAVVFPVWIEEVSGLSPDGGNGEAEMLLAIPFGMASIVLGIMTFRSRRRAAALGG